MLSINDITGWVNDKIRDIIPGFKLYGIAKAAIKGDYIAPYTGEEYIGIDDTYPAQGYHKQLTVSSSIVPRTGYGNNDQDLQNTFTLGLVVYYNENKSGITADQLYTFIQSAVTWRLKADGFRSVRVGVQSAILNDAQVWTQEYGQSPYKLQGSQRLIQVNYNVVMVYDKNCITIPNCKN